MLTLLLLLLLFFLVPAGLRILWWCQRSQWQYWDGEDCRATGLLLDPAHQSSAAVYVLSARTSGLKGALASHSWIVIRRAGSHVYERYDKMGWGDVIWKNGFPADGLWFSNMPVVEHAIEGAAAARLIPLVDAAIASYPFAAQGSYCAWPGPNSNSFVAHVLRAAPEIGRMPVTAIGRDFHPRVTLRWQAEQQALAFSAYGYVGAAVGPRLLEIQFLGLVGGIDLQKGLILVPAFGAVRLWPGRILSEGLRRRYEPADYFDSEAA